MIFVAMTGVVAAVLTNRYGGSVGLAPVAIALTSAALVVGTFIGAAVRRNSEPVWPLVVMTLAAYEGAGLVLSTAHSPVGDGLVVLVESIPAIVGAVAGRAAGAMLADRLARVDARPEAHSVDPTR